MMQAGVRLRQDTETTLPELPEQHRIREKKEELHGLESVHMAESETKCTTAGLNTLEPECVTANSRVSDLHYTEAPLIKTETDLCPISSGVLKTESLDFTDLAYATHLYPDQIKTETVDGDYIKTELVSILPDIKCVYIKSDEDMLESSEVSGSDFMNTVLNGAGVDEKGEAELYHCVGEPSPDGKNSGENRSDLIHDVGILEREKPHQCYSCGRCFFRKSHLIYHLAIHTGEKPYKCEQCEKSFARKCDLNDHQRIHASEKPYECKQCEKCFSYKRQLQRHEQIHTGDKPYKCDQCEKSFLWKHNLNDHQRKHTGDKPFICEHCGKCFGKKNHLQRHEQIHTREKPYNCDQCEKSFAWKSHLYDHQREHASDEPYICVLCGKSFSNKSSLQRHEQIHAVEKPYKCDQCEKSFTRKYNLNDHQRKHA
ncbi:hypothetical protein GJAV_G00087670, partial [Gymnothorax javanicus]